jgi:hypothetical protein
MCLWTLLVTSERECETGSEGSDDNANTSNAGATTSVKVDKTSSLGQVTGNPGVKQICSDSTKVSDETELFFEDGFFDMLCQETNRYYLQNHEKYDRRYKVLKWVDVTLPEMKKVFCNNHYNGASQERQAKRLLVNISVFRNSHFQKAHEP